MSPVRIPGRLTSGGLVGSARIALPIHFAYRCRPFATYRRTSFSSASTIRGCIATAGRQWRLEEFDGSPNLGRLFFDPN
jgi:hypothetical protein